MQNFLKLLSIKIDSFDVKTIGLFSLLLFCLVLIGFIIFKALTYSSIPMEFGIMTRQDELQLYVYGLMVVLALVPTFFVSRFLILHKRSLRKEPMELLEDDK